jgi:hypothetical protein
MSGLRRTLQDENPAISDPQLMDCAGNAHVSNCSIRIGSCRGGRPDNGRFRTQRIRPAIAEVSQLVQFFFRCRVVHARKYCMPQLQSHLKLDRDATWVVSSHRNRRLLWPGPSCRLRNGLINAFSCQHGFFLSAANFLDPLVSSSPHHSCI